MASQRFTHHISQQFDNELEAIRSRVLDMGGLIEDHLNKVLEALSNADADLAEYVATSDDEVNAYENEIDERCTDILLRRQPAASDLRLVLAVSKTITDLERVGDEVEKVGRIVLNLVTADVPRSYYLSLLSIGHHVKRMLHRALDTFARTDSHAAVEVAGLDPEIDEETNAIMRQMITYVLEDPRSITRVLDIVLAARAFERIGDHANNICENVIYYVEGKNVRHTALKDIERELGTEQ